MTADQQKSMARAKAKFFLCLGVLMSLLLYSVSRQQHVGSYEFAILVSVILATLLFDYWKLSQCLDRYEAYKRHLSPDRAIRASLKDTLKSPMLLKLVGTGLLTLHYAFFAAVERDQVVREDSLFSYSKSSNAYDVFLFVALSQLPFLPFVHVIIEYHKGPPLAWGVTLLTLWSVIWYAAQVEAVRCRPVELTGEHLKYRFGLFWAADIPLNNIKMARIIDVADRTEGKSLFLSPFGSKRNVFLEFEAPVEFIGPYFVKKQRRKAAISLDEPARLLSQLAARGVLTA